MTYGEQHVGHVLLYGTFVINHINGFRHAGAFARKDSLIDAERAGRNREKSSVRGNAVAHRDGQNVSWDDVFGVDVRGPAITSDLCDIRRVFLESLIRCQSR